MATQRLQISDTVANAMLDGFESAIGTSAVLEIRSGAIPANCGTARVGTVLATITLPSDWMAAAASRQKAKSGTWSDSSADASGTAGYWSLYESTKTTVHAQGICGVTGSDAYLILSAIALVSGTAFTVNSFTLQAGNQ